MSLEYEVLCTYALQFNTSGGMVPVNGPNAILEAIFKDVHKFKHTSQNFGAFVGTLSD